MINDTKKIDSNVKKIIKRDRIEECVEYLKTVYNKKKTFKRY